MARQGSDQRSHRLQISLCLPGCAGPTPSAFSLHLHLQARSRLTSFLEPPPMTTKSEVYPLTDLVVRHLESRCPWGHTPSRGSREGSFLPSSGLGAPGIPWLVATSCQSLPPSSHGLLLCASVPPLPPPTPAVSVCVKSPSPFLSQGH